MEDLENYKKYVSERLGGLTSIFAKASIGDFSENVDIPEGDDEFTKLYAGISIMLEVIRDKIKKLNNDKKELAVLLNNLPVGVYIAEVPSGRPILTNVKAEELIGQKFDPQAGARKFTKAYSVVNEEGKPYPDEEHPIYITMKTGKPSKKDNIVINRNDGTSISLKAQAVPVFNQEGEMISALAVFDDISREKELEKLQAEFVSLSSHQLRTPLSTTRWNLEGLLKGEMGEMPDKVQAVLQKVYEDNKKMIELVNRLLNLAKLDQGKLPEKPEKTNVYDLVQKAISELEREAKVAKVNITLVELESEEPLIVIDPKLLLEVLLNLLSNAIEYNDKNGKVEVAVERQEGGVRVSVKDTGIGIKTEEKENIFKKFYRGEEAVRKKSEGNGLGLYIVKSYVEGWGGKVGFESEYGKGTTFNIYLPLKPKRLGDGKHSSK